MADVALIQFQVSSTEIYAGGVVVMRASVGTMPSDARILAYRWEPGDGRSWIDTGASPTANIRYAKAGVYNARARVVIYTPRGTAPYFSDAISIRVNPAPAPVPGPPGPPGPGGPPGPVGPTTSPLDGLTDWVKQNQLLLIGGVAAYFFLPMLLSKGKRR